MAGVHHLVYERQLKVQQNTLLGENLSLIQNYRTRVKVSRVRFCPELFIFKLTS